MVVAAVAVAEDIADFGMDIADFGEGSRAADFGCSKADLGAVDLRAVGNFAAGSAGLDKIAAGSRIGIVVGKTQWRAGSFRLDFGRMSFPHRSDSSMDLYWDLYRLDSLRRQ